MRIEWAKVRARANRFTEEVELLGEEMTRAIRFFGFKAAEWKAQTSKPEWMGADIAEKEALNGYAEKQAQIYEDIGANCLRKWKGLPEHISRMRDIIQDPSIAQPGEFNSSMASKANAKARRREMALVREEETNEDDGP